MVADGCVDTATEVEDWAASSSPPQALKAIGTRTRKNKARATGKALFLKCILIVDLRFVAPASLPGGKGLCSTCYETYGIRNRLIS